MELKRKTTTLLMVIPIVSLTKRKYVNGFFNQQSSAERLQQLKNGILINASIISLLAMLLLIVTLKRNAIKSLLTKSLKQLPRMVTILMLLLQDI
jgi:hypothetical protein